MTFLILSFLNLIKKCRLTEKIKKEDSGYFYFGSIEGLIFLFLFYISNFDSLNLLK